MNEYILFGLFFLSVAGCFYVSLLFKKKQILTLRLLNSSLEKEKRLAKENSSLQQSLKKKQNESREKLLKTKNLSKEYLLLKEKCEEDRKSFDKAIAELTIEIKLLRRHKDHDENQITSLTTQLKEFDQEKKALRKKYEINNKFSLQEAQKKQEELKRILEDTNSTIKDKTETIRSLKRKLERQKESQEKIDQEELKNTKHKLQHYQHFYSVVLSQKKMLEERTNNWERALEILSNWIITHHQIPAPSNSNLGEKVALSMETIKKGPLVHDEFSHSNKTIENNHANTQ